MCDWKIPRGLIRCGSPIRRYFHAFQFTQRLILIDARSFIRQHTNDSRNTCMVIF